MNARGLRQVHAVYPGDEFNALRRRLPRAVRRSVEAAPPGHVGLIMQLVGADDCPLVTVHAHAPSQADITRELSRLEITARERLIPGQ